jgi:hypothetical protein
VRELKKIRFARRKGQPDLQGVELSPMPLRQGERNQLADTGPQAVAIVAGSLHHPIDARLRAARSLGERLGVRTKVHRVDPRRV